MNSFNINDSIIGILQQSEDWQQLEWEYPMLLDFLVQNLRYGIFFNEKTHTALDANDEDISVYFSHALLTMAEQERQYTYPIIPVQVSHDIVGYYNTESDVFRTQEHTVAPLTVEQTYHMVLMLPDVNTVFHSVPFYGSENERYEIMDKYENMWNKLYEYYDRYTYQLGGYAHFIQDGNNNTFIMDYRSGYGDNGSFYLHYEQTPSLDLQMF